MLMLDDGVYVNPNHVTAILRFGSYPPQSKVILVDGTKIIVDDRADRVYCKIQKERKQQRG